LATSDPYPNGITAYREEFVSIVNRIRNGKKKERHRKKKAKKKEGWTKD
jgi:hypothetical protein